MNLARLQVEGYAESANCFTVETSRTEQVLIESAQPQGAVLGELRAALEQLGSSEALINLEAAAGAVAHGNVSDWETFRNFITTFKLNVVCEHELPTIFRAYSHASANECRELIELDQRIAEGQSGVPFAEASRRIGQLQLKWLAPLRGERVVARYNAAVQEGKAAAWHTLVYGVTLAVYSIPVRQGLIGYATQILRRYIESAASAFGVGADEQDKLLNGVSADLPQQVERVLNSDRHSTVSPGN